MRPLLILLCLALTACRSLPPIPDRVSPDEYAIYAAWLRHIRQFPQDVIYVLNHTVRMRPECAKSLPKGSVEKPLVDRLVTLGDRTFPLQPSPQLARWKLTPDYVPVWYESNKADVVAFSRVAFNRDHTTALFLVDHVCGGLCGGGGTILARLNNGAWTFQQTGCLWVS